MSKTDPQVNPPEHDPDVARTFSIALATMEDGQLNQDLTDALKEVLHAMNDAAQIGSNSASGSITLTLKFKLDGGLVETRGDFKKTMPKLPRLKSIFWTTPDGNLTRRNPRQRTLPFQQVGTAPAYAVKDV